MLQLGRSWETSRLIAKVPNSTNATTAKLEMSFGIPSLLFIAIYIEVWVSAIGPGSPRTVFIIHFSKYNCEMQQRLSIAVLRPAFKTLGGLSNGSCHAYGPPPYGPLPVPGTRVTQVQLMSTRSSADIAEQLCSTHTLHSVGCRLPAQLSRCCVHCCRQRAHRSNTCCRSITA